MQCPISSSITIGKSFRRGQMATRSAARHQPHHREGRIRLASSAIPAAASRRCSTSSAGLLQATTGGVMLEDTRGRRARSRPRRRVPEPLAAAVADRLRQRRARGRQGVRQHARRKAERHDWVDAQSRSRADGARQGQAPARDLRRHEAARRHRPRAGHASRRCCCSTSRSARSTR